MISKSTQGLVRSQTVESCQVIPSACQSDGVEEGPLVYGIEIVFSKEEWIRFSDISTRQEVVERLAAKLHGKSVWLESLPDIVEDFLCDEEGEVP
jgi:hypothetical protein